MKKRLDQILVDKGLIQSKNKAQALIMAGQVFAGGKMIDKVGTKIDDDVDISMVTSFLL